MEINNGFIEQYDGLVKGVIWKYFKTFSENLYDDMYQAGCIGLIEAAKGYDESKGKFSTHAYAWIFKEIRGVISENFNLIRKPEWILSNKELNEEYRFRFIFFGEEEDIFGDEGYLIENLIYRFTKDRDERDDKDGFLDLVGRVREFLSEDVFRLFVLKYVYGFTYRDLARERGVSSQRMEQFMKTWQEKLKKKIKNWREFF